MQESLTQTIDLPNDDLQTINCMLSFLYLEKYGYEQEELYPTASIAKDKFNERPPNIHIRVYLAADKYGIEPLQQYAGKRLFGWFVFAESPSGHLQVLVDAMKSKPPGDTQMDTIIASILVAQEAMIRKKGLFSYLLQRFSSLAQAFRDEKMRRFINGPLEHRECDECSGSADGFRVYLSPGDFEAGLFRCGFCRICYSIHTFAIRQC
ncbi:uncharacterized protein BDV14DRAFT_205602 [Aspergillus stella-maris]|uniref:uncharacterized protein n=1 Tax=Aspergillus stella-maris TaxID=1810926 RepID=UPI003CCD87BE